MSDGSPLREPIFIIGHQRSGTSLLRACLERHPDVWSVGREAKPIWEKHFHPRLTGWESNELGAEHANEEVRAAIVADLAGIAGKPLQPFDDAEKIGFLKWMRCQGVDPYYYDCRYELLEQNFPRPEREGPPKEHDEPEDEITPYCFPVPSRRPTPEELEGGIRIVEKSIQNAFRIEFLRRLFPDARYVFIVRDGRATVSSSIDAWLHPRGFFSYRMPEELSIGGYSDVYEWGRSWWNLCLPPGWRELKTEPVEQVCASTWVRANEAALAHLDQLERSGVAVLVRYEELVERPVATLRRIADAVGLDPHSDYLRGELPVVMTETGPVKEKWRRRREQIERAMPTMAELQRNLGYETTCA